LTSKDSEKVQSTMTIYEYISDSELIHEIDIIDTLVKTLATQQEKLDKLKAEGKVSKSTYIDIQEELDKRAAIIIRKMDELLLAVDEKIKLINSQIAKFKHELELLEIRHIIGAIPDTKYITTHERIQIQLNEIEGTKNGIIRLVSGLFENSRIIGQHVPNGIMTINQTTQNTLEHTLKPYQKGSLNSASASQPISDIIPVEIHSKPKIVKCLKCGKEILKGATYCYYCGASMLV
jgi:hypothetical protein